MLLGLYSRILDNKNRLELPKEYQEQLNDGVYIAQGFDRNIMILTLEAFEEVYERVSSVNIADPLARLLLRMILSSTYKAEVEKDGTIPISDSLKKLAQLEKDVVLVGQGDYIEIWSLELWNKQAEHIVDAESNANRFASLLITTR